VGQPIDPQKAVPPVPPLSLSRAGDSTVHEAQRKSEGQQPAAQPPVIVNIPSQPPQSNKLMNWLTAVIAVATAINVLVFYLESESTGKQIDKLTTKAGGIVDATNAALNDSRNSIKDAFNQNKSAVDASTQQSKKALDASIQIARRDQRAYVSTTRFVMGNPAICTFPPPSEQGSRICVDVHMLNVGRTPAVGALIVRRITFGPDATKTVGEFKVPPYVKPAGDLWGSGPESDKFVTAVSEVIDEKTAQDLVNATALNTLIYAYGVVQYRDIFGDYHETGYCSHRVLNSTSFITCDVGNWFDKRPSQPR